MTPPTFCPSCGSRRLPDTRFCGSCGADFGGAEPASPPSAARPAGAGEDAPVAGPGARPLEAVRSDGAAPRPPGQGRRPRLAGLALIVVVVAALIGVGTVLLVVRPIASPGIAAGSPFPSPIALSSPPASRGPQIGDPNTAAYQAGSGFTPDAARVLTVTVLQLSLDQYRAAVGTYPATLDALFPTYAPPGPDGRPMTSAPAATDGYIYVGSGAAYTLSVTLTTGQTYTVSGP